MKALAYIITKLAAEKLIFCAYSSLQSSLFFEAILLVLLVITSLPCLWGTQLWRR